MSAESWTFDEHVHQAFQNALVAMMDYFKAVHDRLTAENAQLKRDNERLGLEVAKLRDEKREAREVSR